MDDVDRFVEIVASAIETATAPLLARIAALERQKAIVPRDGRDGKDGISVNLTDVSPVISSEVEKVFRSMLPVLKSACLSEIPQPKDGAPGPQGEPGQDAPAPDMDAIVTRALALVPPPVRGEKGEQGPTGPAGERGQDAPLPDGDAIVTRVLALLPPPKRGEQGDRGEAGPVGPIGPSGEMGKKGDAGRDGKDAVVPDVDAMVADAVSSNKFGCRAEIVAAVVSAIPVPTNGRDGVDGVDGRSVTVDDVAPLIVREIEHRVAAIPAAKNGVGFTGAVVNREGHLVLTLSNGTTQDIGPVIGKDGAPGIDGKDAVGTPGKDGLDGLGFDDFDLYLDEARGWVLRLAQGTRVKEWELGIPFDAKVWAAGTVYPKGAGATWDGHYWIAQAQTSEQPGEGCPAWRLAVRRGKQGREGKQGKDGSAGRDLTQIDPGTGRKW